MHHATTWAASDLTHDNFLGCFIHYLASAASVINSAEIKKQNNNNKEKKIA